MEDAGVDGNSLLHSVVAASVGTRLTLKKSLLFEIVALPIL